MKKLLTLMMCLMLALTITGCGKDKKDPAPTPEDFGLETSTTESEQKAEPAAAPDVTPEELGSMVDEFNNTDDPARKEELGKEITKILEQIEGTASVPVEAE